MRPTVTDLRRVPTEQLRREWLLLLTRARTLRNRQAMADVEHELIRRSWEAESR